MINNKNENKNNSDLDHNHGYDKNSNNNNDNETNYSDTEIEMMLRINSTSQKKNEICFALFYLTMIFPPVINISKTLAAYEKKELTVKIMISKRLKNQVKR